MKNIDSKRREKAHLNIFIDAEIYKLAKMYAIHKNMFTTEVIEKALLYYLPSEINAKYEENSKVKTTVGEKSACEITTNMTAGVATFPKRKPDTQGAAVPGVDAEVI